MVMLTLGKNKRNTRRVIRPEKRAIFDEELDATGESADTDTVSGYLATKSQSFSVHYRHQHAQYLEEYEARSIAAISIANTMPYRKSMVHNDHVLFLHHP